MEVEQKKIVCPNCGAQAIKDGTKVVCETCDATYSFKKTGGAKVDNIGRLDSIEDRLQKVESLLPGGESDPADPADPEDPADPADPADPPKVHNPNAENLLGPE